MKLFYSDNMTRKRIVNYLSAFGFVFLSALSGYAVAPVNDHFGSAQLISGQSGQVSGTNVDATIQVGEPAHALNRGGNSVWYKYVATGNGVLYVSTENSPFDTTLAVYRGSTLSNLELLGANNDTVTQGGWSGQSRVRIGTEAGVTYYIAVDGKYYRNDGTTADGAITLQYSFSNAATNDSFATPISFTGYQGSMVSSNVGASKELGEPNHGSNPGGRSVWFKWTSPAQSASYTFSANSVDPAGDGTIYTAFGVYTGSSVATLTPVVGITRSGFTHLTFIAAPNTTYYIALDGFDSGSGAKTGTFTLSFRRTKNSKQADFDADGLADIAVYRPTTGTWYSLDSSTDKLRAFRFGANGDKPMFNRLGGDDRADYTVFRPDNGMWYIDDSGPAGIHYMHWGSNTDIPMIRKTNHQNTSFPLVFRPQDGTWWIFSSDSSYGLSWGQSGDLPVLADFVGKGTDQLTVFRPSNGVWYVLLDQQTGEYRSVQWGQAGDIPVPADYDGDGLADIAIYRPATGEWWYISSLTNQSGVIVFGATGDIPQPADYDGDGKDDCAVYRNGTWWIRKSSNGQAIAHSFGFPTDVPITSPIR